ncbi:hypothetical protein ANCCAN_13261 [Ancylostoma caninum]|uniref:Uncharacterized protein n=1 Tax=Ancylostoma caninum TaxID=29170 RepID=A0A368G8T2_ANCCA|nr:hypothetical protein ANCCAN_13261 [Ancylostoma caninum]
MFQVFYPSNMKEGSRFITCRAEERLRCSDGLSHALSVYDHRNYFNLEVSTYGVKGCVDPSTTSLLEWIRSKTRFWH